MASGKSAFIVTGDPSRNKVLTVPGGGFATVKIALPKVWDALMAGRGYKPLADFRLATDLTPDVPQATSRNRSPFRGQDAMRGGRRDGERRRPRFRRYREIAPQDVRQK